MTVSGVNAAFFEKTGAAAHPASVLRGGTAAGA